MLPCRQLSSGSCPRCILAPMRRPVLAVAVVLTAIGAFTGGLAWLLDTPRPPAGASRAERLYLGLCGTCHVPERLGSWCAALFLVRHGMLDDAAPLHRLS